MFRFLVAVFTGLVSDAQEIPGLLGGCNPRSEFASKTQLSGDKLSITLDKDPFRLINM